MHVKLYSDRLLAELFPNIEGLNKVRLGHGETGSLPSSMFRGVYLEVWNGENVPARSTGLALAHDPVHTWDVPFVYISGSISLSLTSIAELDQLLYRELWLGEGGLRAKVMADMMGDGGK